MKSHPPSPRPSNIKCRKSFKCSACYSSVHAVLVKWRPAAVVYSGIRTALILRTLPAVVSWSTSWTSARKTRAVVQWITGWTGTRETQVPDRELLQRVCVCVCSHFTDHLRQLRKRSKVEDYCPQYNVGWAKSPKHSTNSYIPYLYFNECLWTHQRKKIITGANKRPIHEIQGIISYYPQINTTPLERMTSHTVVQCMQTMFMLPRSMGTHCTSSRARPNRASCNRIKMTEHETIQTCVQWNSS